MFNADGPESAVVSTLVRRCEAVPEQISRMSLKMWGTAVAASASFTSASGQLLDAVVAVAEVRPGHWVVLGDASCPSAEGSLESELWRGFGGWTTSIEGERRPISVIGGATAESVASVVATDRHGTVLEDQPKRGLVVLGGNCAFHLPSARLLLVDAAESVLWEGPLVSGTTWSR